MSEAKCSNVSEDANANFTLMATKNSKNYLNKTTSMSVGLPKTKMQERNTQGVGQLFCWIYAVRSLLKILGLKLLKEQNQSHKEGLSKLLV